MIDEIKELFSFNGSEDVCDHSRDYEGSSEWLQVYTKSSKRHEEKDLDIDTNKSWTEYDGVIIKTKEVEIKYVCKRCGEEKIIYTGKRLEGEENIINKKTTTRIEAARKIKEDTGQEHIAGGWNSDKVKYWSFSPFRGDNKTLSQLKLFDEN